MISQFFRYRNVLIGLMVTTLTRKIVFHFLWYIILPIKLWCFPRWDDLGNYGIFLPWSFCQTLPCHLFQDYRLYVLPSPRLLNFGVPLFKRGWGMELSSEKFVNPTVHLLLGLNRLIHMDNFFWHNIYLGLLIPHLDNIVIDTPLVTRWSILSTLGQILLQ